MPLTPPKKRTYWISIIFLILGLVFFILGLLEAFGIFPILGPLLLAWVWIVLTFLFLFLAWFMLFGGVSWKGF